MNDRYARRGVSSGKEEVHAAISGLDLGQFPRAFCKILPDVAGGDPDWYNIMHADTAGTKTSLAYLYWKETGDVSVWRGIAQDALVMNLDDMACVGCTTDILVSSVIARNKHLIPGEVIQTLIRWLPEFAASLEPWGIRIHSAGGETADVGDIVRTIDVGYSTFGRLHKSRLLVNDIRPGQIVIGFASYGQTRYEDQYNSGIGSNGLTSARHDLLSSDYRFAYPESYAPETDPAVVYTGTYRLTDKIELDKGSFRIGELLLSPTRTYLPLIHALLGELRSGIHGLIHCTGGGQTKVAKFIAQGRVVKDNLLPVPPVFELIRNQSGTSEEEMFRVFNMGQRLECFADPAAADEIVAMAQDLGIEAQITGRVVAADQPGVEIQTAAGTWYYPA